MFVIRAFKTKSPARLGTQSRFHILNRRGFSSQAGFTLIEIIVSLILVGILASIGGMAIVQAVQGYIMTRENSATTQKAQMAISRITREIIEMINIPSDATATALPINNINGNRTIGLNSGAVKIAFGADILANGDILIDNVSTFTLTYYSRNSSSGTVVTASTWPATNDITTLTTIDINLQINRAGGGILTFSNRVAPRNNKNQGGAAPSALPPSAPSYGSGSGCFVATVAYGDPGHPMVRILRDFRDRYLLPWRGGRWLVKKYYEHGPAAADIIRNRPLAMWAVRCLLAPVVALTFFLIYAPLAILFLLPVSLILTGALFSAVQRGAIPLCSSVFRARGSVLIGLIVTMVIMATLSAAMLPMFSASYMNQVYADQGRKTYLLAESGFRYAASQFLNAGNEAGRLAAMTAMNNKTCNLLNDAGSFTTRVYPYWFKTQATAAGATTLATQVYGTIPLEFSGNILSGGQIRVGTSYYSYSSSNGSGTTITFSGLSPALPVIPATPQLDVQPMTQPGSAQSLSKGGSLTLSGTGSGFFPLLNGNFIMYPAPTGIPNGAVFNYTKRTGSTLSNVTLSDGTQNTNWTSALSITAETKVVLDKFIRLSSTGTVGNASREVIYNVPVGWITGGGQDFIKAQDIDPMNTAANWVIPSDGGGGTHNVYTVDGGSALKVDSAPSSGGWWTNTGNWATTFFNGYSSTNLAQAWLDAQGFLSYDLQVKVYNTQPYFFAGMSFRNRNNSDLSDLYSYGVSFIKPRQTQYWFFGWGNWVTPSDQATSLIPGFVSDPSPGPLFTGSLETKTYGWFNTIRDRYGLPAIVLWKRTSAGFTWLAYRILTTLDGIVYAPGSPANALRLTNWSTLMVRVSEGYSLDFGNGGGLINPGVPIKEGDVIETLDKTSSARIVMTPILTGGSWTARNAAGTFVLANIVTGTTAISNNVALYVNGVELARATGGIVNTKKNYLRVYFTDPTAQGTANNDETDSDHRKANPRDSVNWPPDDLNDLVTSSDYDYVTLAQWTGYNTGISAFTSTSEPYAIIVDSDLTTPTWTSTSTTADFAFPNGNTGDSIALVTSSGSATSTYYDDFAIQLDQKAGTGFLPPIQQ
jgi:prepilin-type N-terminal cleavage/methylation domain-containing protein